MTTRSSREGDPDHGASEAASAASFDLEVDTAGHSRFFRLNERRTYLVGRSADCDVSLFDAAVSRVHARLFVDDGVWLEDAGARNPTLIGGRPLGAAERVRLPIGEPVTLGATTLVVHEARPARSDATAFGASTPATLPPPASGIPARSSVPSTTDPREPVAADPATQRVLELLDAVAPTALRVLLLGETGVGKDVLARALHRRSERASGPFVQLNCAALPEALLEAELFGHEKGAFTGATHTKPGLVEAADRGTLFLDEVGEMPLTTQAKLLLFLESGEVLRVGGRRPRHVDVRVVGATNRDLARAVSQGNFRADLFFRLNGISIAVPPLRRRIADIAPLARRFAHDAAARLGRPEQELTPAAIARLEAWPWPGNVRELRNVVERAVVLCKAPRIAADHLLLDTDVEGDAALRPLAAPNAMPSVPSLSSATSEVAAFPFESPTLTRMAPVPNDGAPPSQLAPQIRAVERDRILEALALCGGNQSRTARLLGISRTMLIRRIEAYGLARPRKPRDG